LTDGLTSTAFGVFSTGTGSADQRGEPGGGAATADERRVGVRVGDRVLDLSALDALGMLPGERLFAGRSSLDTLLAAGQPVWRDVVAAVRGLVASDDSRVAEAMVPAGGLRLHLPWTVGDYVDFYSSEHHASNVGRIFRPDSPPLLPNWKHLPVGYHGRAGTVVVSGTPVVRPCGQRKPPSADAPTYGPSARLDIEAEVGFVVGVPSTLGSAVPAASFRSHVFGVVLLNDWSSRDLQAWEYVPLGPFLGKSFATSVSAWVTPLEDLDAAWVPGPEQDPPVLDYLRVDEPRGLDLSIEVVWNGEVVSRPPFGQMYWSPAQQLAHLTVNGASLRTGDLYASGTVSGPAREQVGSFLELSWGGREPITVGGQARTFLEDGDEVTLRATAPAIGGGRLDLGEVSGRVLPAR
jgi:fumarylacetoacetase